MNISNFFVNRPIFATVLSIIIALVGLISMRALPIAQYPDVVPPEITVSATYPGANAETVSNTVASQLAESINGTEDMIYMYANSSDDGLMSMHVAFNIGSDPNIDQVNVNNRVQQALSKLPQEVQDQGVTVELRSSSILMLPVLVSDQYDQNYLRNYASLHLTDELKQVDGVGDAEVLGGSDMAMRIWIKPDKLSQYDITPLEVNQAIQAQNAAVPAGNLSGEPMEKSRAFTYTISTQGRLSSAEEFKNIILRTNPDGSTLRLKDVARVELGMSSYTINASLNGRAMAPIMVQQQPGANALDTATKAKAALDRMRATLPAGVDIEVPYDTTLFIDASVESVVHTFIEALILVAIIVFVFLQNWRTTAIAMSVVPISVVGTFAGMYLLDFSINLLSLFGMILAIGIVVDDAILVVENVERLVEDDEDISVFDATLEAMREVGGPVIATAFIMASVFVPVGFLGGLTGEIYRQFAITIAISVAISAFIALTFTPALTTILLKRRKKVENNPIAKLLSVPFKIFDAIFDKITAVYLAFVRFFARMWALSLVVLVLISGAAVLIYQNSGSGLIPTTDQGLYIMAVNAPDGASVARTTEYMDKLQKKIQQQDGVKFVTSVSGYDFLNSAANTARGLFFVTMVPWSDRSVSVDQSIAESTKLANSIPGGTAMAFNMPPIIGLSTTGGLEGYLVSRNGADSDQMAEAAAKLMKAAQSRPELAQTFSTYTNAVPAYHAEIDYDKATAYGVTISDLNNTLSTTFGSGFVNYFTYHQRNFGVYIQNESEYRATPEDLNRTYVRSSSSGSRIPLSSFVTLKRTNQAPLVTRFNVYPAAKFQAAPAPGYSSGEAMQALQEVTHDTLGNDWDMSWSGTSYQEQAAGGAAGIAIVFGLLMVFLILAAQYESWTTPLAVVTAVPFGFFGAILAIWLRGLDVDVYVNVGFLVVVGLAAKNAILIVEFATMLRKDQGMSIYEAAVEAAHLRFRPIIMTSLAFILGVLPLAFASGASDTNSHDIGTTVAGGMVAVAILASIFVPAYYVVIAGAQQWVSNKLGKGKKEQPETRQQGDNSQHQQ